ncbi:methylamine utilization protein [Mitsuaria sp. GD03876]|uniref:methylamine utilization protein n=1 Tax=Mitsuaria sp. GD03876 TaxID=2975399 RepID=UPI0024492EEA|nr:methylamine utilization protein [Mitsuaria sp. GD03876]MDH0864065.1 methylamine utilization protein [Mitsuaria sp. GD03876]
MSLHRFIAPAAGRSGFPPHPPSIDPPVPATGARAAASWRAASALALTAGALFGAAPARAADWTIHVVDASGAPVPDAVVAVELKGQPAPPAVGKSAVMAQRDRQFQPQLLAIQTGTAVTFPNFDTVRHHVYSFSPTKKFELKLYSGTPAEPVVFDKAGVAQLGCNIHDRMSAHIVVVDTPLFGIADAKGDVRLDLPPGSHRLRLWAARLGNAAPTVQPLTVGTGAPGVLKVELKD